MMTEEEERDIIGWWSLLLSIVVVGLAIPLLIVALAAGREGEEKEEFDVFDAFDIVLDDNARISKEAQGQNAQKARWVDDVGADSCFHGVAVIRQQGR